MGSIADIKIKLAERKQKLAQGDGGAAATPKKLLTVSATTELNKPVLAVIPELEAIGQNAATESAQRQIEEMNKTFFVAPYGGGVVRIFQETWDCELDRPTLDILTPDSLRLMLKNKLVTIIDKDGNTKQIPRAEFWMSHPARREYPGGIALLPNLPTPPGVYNLYRGRGIEPQAGDVAPALLHIQTVICAGDKKLAHYVICWCARAVQRPELPAEVALVMRGGRGTGKGTLGRWLLKIFGTHGLQISQSRHFTGNFNAHLRDCLMLFCDEAYYSGDKSSEAVIKALITEDTIAIERKGVDVVSAKNRLKIIMASNSDWVAPAGPDERRFCVVAVSDCHKQDHGYFAALNKHMDNGGLAAFLDYLLKVDLADFNIRAVPSTRALEEQKLLSMPPLATWLYARLTEGRLTSLESEWKPRQLRDSVCGDFGAFVKSHGLRYVHMDSASVGRQLRELIPAIVSKREPGGLRRWQWEFPSLDESRQAFVTHMGFEHVSWPEDGTNEQCLDG